MRAVLTMAQMQKEYNLPLSELAAGLARFQETSEFCDAEVKAEGRVFKVHRVVLASVSPYFRSMYTGDFKERKSDEAVEIKVLKLTLS